MDQYLSHDVYVPQKTIDKFNRLSNLMRENGLHHFFESFLTFWLRVWGENNEEDSEYKPVTFDEFYYFMLLLFWFLFFTFTVFICEILWFHTQRRYQRFLNQWNQLIIWILLK